MQAFTLFFISKVYFRSFKICDSVTKVLVQTLPVIRQQCRLVLQLMLHRHGLLFQQEYNPDKCLIYIAGVHVDRK